MTIYLTKKYLLLSVISFVIAIILFIILFYANAYAAVTYKIALHNSGLNLAKVDTSIKRTCEIVPKLLGMEKVDLNVTICFVRDRAELRAKYPIKIGRIPEAYFVPALNTIFMYRYSRPIFAHELTHALLDAYFGKLFPHKIQEIIPQYIEDMIRKIY